MKFLLLLWLVLSPLSALAATTVPKLSARAWIMIDQASGQELAAKNADVQYAPASLTKMMTAYLLFTDLRNKKLSLGGTLSVPEGALKADGETIFLGAGDAVSVDELLQGMLVQSASDATQTLVGAAAGTPGAFVERMNSEAVRLGMTRTKFANAIGLDEAGHISTARDMAILARALQTNFPEYQKYFSQKEFVHKGITFYNSNRLLWMDGGTDGLKTGHTVRAGYCVAASARRGDQRRIAVVLGAASDTQRTQGARNLLNYGFENFDSARLYRARQAIKSIKMYRGVRESVSIGFEQDFYLLIPQGAAPRLKAQVLTQQPVVAPIQRGQVLGTLRLSLDGKPLGDYPLRALHGVTVSGVLGRGWDSIKLLFAK